MAANDPPQPRPRVRPERDVDHPGLVLEGQEHRPLGRHRVLAGDDEATDPDRPRPPVSQRGVRHRTEAIQHATVERDHLAAGIEPDHGIGIADPLGLGQRPAAAARRSAAGGGPSAGRRPVPEPSRGPCRRPRGAARAARAAADRANPAPRPGSAARSPPRPGPSARRRPRASHTDRAPAPRPGAASWSSPIPFTSPRPSRTPQPAALSGDHFSRDSREGITHAGERTGSGRRSMPASPGSGSSTPSAVAQPGRPTHSVVVL